MTKGQKVTKLTQDTLMPLSLIATLFYLIFAVGGKDQQLQANTAKIEIMEIADKEQLKALKSVEFKLIKMQATLDLLAK